MDYNAKWGWENLVLFNSKTAEISKQQTPNWEVVEGEEIMVTGPFCLHEGKGNSSGSELARDSSTRSPMSVCTDSSFKEEVIENTQNASGNKNDFSEDISEKVDLQTEQHEQSPSVGSVESLIGLELGKRMYFENNGCTKTVSFPELPVKKIKPSNQNTPRCQVAGCNLDLSLAKEYYRKHRVCGSHSKCPKVVVGGLERRFCQQCSRFHSLSEFDEMKKSCRRKLSDHNARRRRPQRHPVLQFNTMGMPFPLSAFPHTEDRRQIGFISNNAPSPIYSRSFADPTWESSFCPRYTTTKSCMLEFGNPKGLDEKQLLQFAGTQFPRPTSLPGHSFNKFLSSKGARSENLTRGFKEYVLPPNLNSSTDFHQLALSLLSNDTSWASYPTSNNSLDQSININHMYHQPLMQRFPQSFQMTSSELGETDHHSPNSLTPTANETGHFQLFKAPYENTLYSNLFN